MSDPIFPLPHFSFFLQPHFSSINPVKHGLVQQVKDWPYSTFHQLVEQGIYPENWGGDADKELSDED